MTTAQVAAFWPHTINEVQRRVAVIYLAPESVLSVPAPKRPSRVWRVLRRFLPLDDDPEGAAYGWD